MSVPHRMFVRMTFVEGALIRLLGLIGRRGFEVTKVDARRLERGHAYEITLEVAGPRCVLTLQRQIAKLCDVQIVEIVPALYDTPPIRIAADAIPTMSVAKPLAV